MDVCTKLLGLSKAISFQKSVNISAAVAGPKKSELKHLSVTVLFCRHEYNYHIHLLFVVDLIQAFIKP